MIVNLTTFFWISGLCVTVPVITGSTPSPPKEGRARAGTLRGRLQGGGPSAVSPPGDMRSMRQERARLVQARAEVLVESSMGPPGLALADGGGVGRRCPMFLVVVDLPLWAVDWAQARSGFYAECIIDLFPEPDTLCADALAARAAFPLRVSRSATARPRARCVIVRGGSAMPNAAIARSASTVQNC